MIQERLTRFEIKHPVKALDYGDLDYVGNIKIGTPSSQFTAVLDTGSAIIWVPGVGCENSFMSQEDRDGMLGLCLAVDEGDVMPPLINAINQGETITLRRL
uniref:Peptidase A1 domain-containing protein n=1 Tax=Angiostrongylus cantonensis TaxID=6313 RepID=A0A158PC03_ANGCA